MALSLSCRDRLGVEARLETSTGDEKEDGSMVCLSSADEAVDGLLSLLLDA